MPPRMKKARVPTDLRKRIELIGNGALAIIRKHQAAKGAAEPEKRIVLKPRKKF